MSEKVIAEVILRSADGSSILDRKEVIIAGNIEKYEIGKDVIEEASKKLEELDFKVLHAGPVSLTIAGDKAVFESVFRITLAAGSADIMGTKTSGIEAPYYETAKLIEIPENLSSLVADVVLPTPPEFFP